MPFLPLLLSLTPQPPPPPYRRQKTVTVWKDAYEPPRSVNGSVFFSANRATIAAYLLPSLTRKWAFQLPGSEQAGKLAVANGAVYLTSEPELGNPGAHLYALDARTGKLLWKLARTGPATPVAAAAGVVYAGLAPNSVAAVDRKSHATRWIHRFTTSTGERRAPDTTDAIVAADGRLLVNHGNVTYCLDASSGREQWHQDKSYVLWGGIPVADGIAAVPAGEGVVARELRTGSELWKEEKDGFSDGASAANHRFIGIGRGQLRAVEARSGRVSWSVPVGPGSTSGGNQYVSILGDRIYACGIQRAVVVGMDGKLLSSGPPSEALARPIWADATSLVCFDTSNLLVYRHGEEPPVAADPAAKRRLANDLTRRFASLDGRELARLRSLGDSAFEPVLAAFRATCASYDAAGNGANGFPLYQRYHSLAEVLDAITTRNRTPDLLRALQKTSKNGSARPTILELLAKVGDPAVVTPYFLAEMKTPRTPGFEMYESTTYVARQYVSKSRDPRAVAFLIQQLHDPMADQQLRSEAYVHLAGTGAPEAIQAVLAERSKRTLLRPLADRVIEGVLHAGEFGKKTGVLGEKKDAQGRTWGLLQSGVLGSAGDLWLAEEVNGKWVRPLFTGVSTMGVSRWAQPVPPEPKIGGKTGKELAAGDWLAILANNAEIRRDSDGDGLTDLVEQRLGTDPHQKDSDGDGDPDEVDPWPNAAPRPLTEEEQVYAAVFEARFHFDASEGPALLYSPGKMKPFEMPGRRGPTIWVPADHKAWTHPLEHCYEQGIALIHFSPATRGSKSDEPITWNKEHTEATLSISVYYGGLNGTGYNARVRKINGEWLVVALDQGWVS